MKAWPRRGLYVALAAGALGLGWAALSQREAPGVPVAELTSFEGGSVERAAEATSAFVPAGAGALLGDGELLQTSAGARAELRLGAQLRLTVASGSRVRFTSVGRGTGLEPGLDVESGKAVVWSAGGSARLQTSAGPIAVPPEGSVVLGQDGAAVLVNVVLGDLALGEVAPSGISAARIHASATLPAGENAVVHATTAPVHLAIALPSRCTGGGELELPARGLRAPGKESVLVAFEPGTSPYVLRCGGEVVARGRVALLLDTGYEPLPVLAPMADIETDGRAYTLTYQHQPPGLRVHWPRAPERGPYLLAVDDASHTTEQPSHTLPSGSLADGEHRLSWSAGDRSSRSTVVTLRYDVSAPKLRMVQPRERGFRVGDDVRVQAQVLGGWSARVLNGEGALDPQGQLVGHSRTRSEAPDVAVRLSHPRYGVHYYVRRAMKLP